MPQLLPRLPRHPLRGVHYYLWSVSSELSKSHTSLHYHRGYQLSDGSSGMQLEPSATNGLHHTPNHRGLSEYLTRISLATYDILSLGSLYTHRISIHIYSQRSKHIIRAQQNQVEKHRRARDDERGGEVNAKTSQNGNPVLSRLDFIDWSV